MTLGLSDVATIKGINSVQEALDLLERAVQEKGEGHTYNQERHAGNCYYFEPDSREPGCIVGHVLSYVGFTAEDAANLEIENKAVRRFDFPAPGIAAVLGAAQHSQDDGHTWGEALSDARAIAARWLAEHGD